MKWEVRGADRKTGVDQVMVLTGEDEASVRHQAMLRGLMVETIRDIGPEEPTPHQKKKQRSLMEKALGPINAGSDEAVFFNSPEALVTDKKITLGRRTYPLETVTGAEIVSSQDKKGMAAITGWFSSSSGGGSGSYTIRLTTRTGTVNALTHSDGELLRRVGKAIREALSTKR